ncbi:TVP38/TMEM64 family protein [Pseudonocardia adelaidensis]|uniref:TVP38/TMEM64 family membrane protein n=1 Tax=Pseudonocardia adelaidensis TaxID=648754 RepID=A0ABP9NR65_9PSEU
MSSTTLPDPPLPDIGTFGGVSWGRIAAAGTAVLVVAVVAFLLYRTGTDLLDVRTAVRAAGLWAPLLFVLLQGMVTVTPVPRTVFTVAAGVLFGGIGGVVLAVAGTSLAAAVAFWLVKLLGGRFTRRHTDHRVMTWVRARLDRSGLLAMVSLRLIPAVPFSAMNYASALAGVRFAPYLLGTVLGVLPGTIGIVILGDAAVGGNPHPAMLLISVCSGLVGLTGALIAARRPAISPVGEE